jgi:seryl-tRNA synthetase
VILDSLVAFLLFVTILYCWRLSRKISALNSNRKELQSIIAEFDKAIIRAEKGVTTLKNLSQEADDQLQKHIEKARFLTNDLAFLTHKADNIAETLEVQIRSQGISSSKIRFTGKPQHTTEKRSIPATIENPGSLHKNLGWKNVNDSPQNDMPPSKRKVLEDVLEQIAARKKQSSGKNKNTTTQAGA